MTDQVIQHILTALPNTFVYCSCQLISAGCSFHIAIIASQEVCNFFGILAFNQKSYRLEVAVATADEPDVVKLAVINIEIDLHRADAARVE
jgi:hypothetical protein